MIHNPLVVTTALASGATKIVCVSSITTAGPLTSVPTGSVFSTYTGVLSTLPILSKYTLLTELGLR